MYLKNNLILCFYEQKNNNIWVDNNQSKLFEYANNLLDDDSALHSSH